jgi:hypothetical protein
VWWKNKDENSVRSFPLKPEDILKSPDLNGLLPRIAGWKVDAHPGLPAIAAKFGVDEAFQKGMCSDSTCLTDALAQIEELSRTHTLATSHVKRVGLEASFPGGAAALRSLPVIRTRPDVTVRTGCRDFECKVAGGVKFDHVGPPGDGIASLVQRLDEGGHDRVMAGYQGPWPGGWSDIAYASTYGAFDDLVGEGVHLPLLAQLVKTPPMPNNFVSADMTKNMNKHHDQVVKWWNERGFHAEMVWMMILTAKGFHANFYHFCAVMRWRAGLRGDGELFLRAAMPHMC